MTKILYIAIGILLITAALLVGTILVGISSGSEQDKGKELYDGKCQVCHGIKGDGKGSAAAFLCSSPSDFTNPGFWWNNFD